MKNRSKIMGWISLAMLCLSSVAQAANTASATQERSEERQNRPLWLYGAVGAGYVNDSGIEFQNAPDGPVLMLGGVVAYKIPTWVFDGGAFWADSNLSGTLPTGQSIKIQTRSAMFELSPRYRLSKAWDIGPTAQILVGTNTNFSQVNDSTSSALFGGLKVSYEIPSDSLNVRLTLSGAPSITVSNRQVWLVLAGLQIGLPLSGASNAQPEPKPAPYPTVQPAIFLNQPQPELRVTLPPRVVYFKTASWTLNSRAQEILRKIGVLLGQHEDAWGALEISGHTDERGSYTYNLKLSQHRSDSVIAQLARGGADRSKMKMEAFAFTRPAVQGKNEDAWAQNRRVELVFKNVSDPQLLESEITKIIIRDKAPE